MSRIFLDTNFVLDYFVRESEGGDCERLLSCCHARRDSFYISYLTVANFAYIMRKLPKESLYGMIGRMCEAFRVVKNTREQILKNIQLGAEDFEDGLQYQAAMDAGCDVIISRNQKDFSFCEVPVMSASEYLTSLGV